MSLAVSEEKNPCDIMPQKKSNWFELKRGNLINLTFWFCED